MDINKFSAIGHRYHDFCSPVNEQAIDRVIELLQLQPGDRVLDAGCGKAEILIRLSAGCQIQAIGVDHSSYFITAAQEAIARRAPGADIHLYTQDISEYEAVSESFQLAICLGSTHLYGSFSGTLEALQDLVKPGGFLLVGDLYWQRQPEDAFLEMLDIPADAIDSYTGYINQAEFAGLRPLYSAVSSQDDWDHYEWRITYAIQMYIQENPDFPELEALRQYGELQRTRYLRWGRDTLGFGLYLLQKPLNNMDRTA